MVSPWGRHVGYSMVHGRERGKAMVRTRRINRCALLASLGLSVNLIWCTLAGHAMGFSATPDELGLPVNSRLFFLLGIFAVGAAFVVVPRILREHDRPLTYVLPFASSVGTACFALAARQSLFPPAVLAVVGLVVFGIGYFWIVARYNLLLARTQTFACAAWCIVAALAVESLVLPFFEAFVPPIFQIVTAIARCRSFRRFCSRERGGPPLFPLPRKPMVPKKPYPKAGHGVQAFHRNRARRPATGKACWFS